MERLALKAATICKSAESIPCERNSCITIYTSKNCLFCDLVATKIEEILVHLGFSPYIIRKLEVDELDEEELAGIYLLPTVNICDTTLHGIPSEATVTDAVTRAIFKGCFST
ncbi:MAG: hypothetical protein BAJATHORv1_20041 [Candidatus Thorarchaeota archaeon]|nr:MAG: hypothetical protein BAJATHORv1_20041 [Candidatus Thorarchaeota archaeon]